MQILKILLLLNFSVLVGAAFADDANTSKVQAMQQLESAFIVQSGTFTASSAINTVNWPEELNLYIDNKWQFNFTSKNPITISRVTLGMDGTAIGNQVNLVLKPETEAHYFFADVKLAEIIKKLAYGYKVVGVRKRIAATDFTGFSDYKYKVIQVTVAWTDEKNNYNQSVTDFMLVMAK